MKEVEKLRFRIIIILLLFILGFGILDYLNNYLSGKVVIPICGNNICESAESVDYCPKDCPIYVDMNSIGGRCSDYNIGTITQPICTVSEGVKRLRSEQTLYIRDGTYYINPTLPWDKAVLGPEKSGTLSYRTKILRYPGEDVNLTNAVKITGWTPVIKNGRTLLYHKTDKKYLIKAAYLNNRIISPAKYKDFQDDFSCFSDDILNEENTWCIYYPTGIIYLYLGEGKSYSNIDIKFSLSQSRFLVLNGSYFQISGLNFINVDYPIWMEPVQAEEKKGNSIVSNNNFVNNVQSISIWRGQDNSIIEKNIFKFVGSSVWGHPIYHQASHTTIRNNYFIDFTGYGIHSYCSYHDAFCPMEDISIYDNQFIKYNNKIPFSWGVVVKGKNYRIYNNEFTNLYRAYTMLDYVGDSVFENNVIKNNDVGMLIQNLDGVSGNKFINNYVDANSIYLYLKDPNFDLSFNQYKKSPTYFLYNYALNAVDTNQIYDIKKLGYEFGSFIIQCSDGIDNDGDGKIDYGSDNGCRDIMDNDEKTQCQDGIDNDGNGRIDYPDDRGCSSIYDDDERFRL